MRIGGAKPYVFKPARRVFAGRGRSMLTFGEWKIAFAAMAFGGVVVALWVGAPIVEGDGLALSPPRLTMSAPSQSQSQSQPEPQTRHEAFGVVPASTEVRAPEARGHVIAEAARIIDGDTLYLEGVSTRIRLWGVDAPERDENGFEKANETLTALVAGRVLACEQVDTDPYARIVARCFIDDGRDLSAAMISSGAAREYLRFTGGYYSGQ